jgi:hypothetical protein
VALPPAVDREHELEARVEPLPVNLYRRPARETELQVGGQAAERAAGEALKTLSECEV